MCILDQLREVEQINAQRIREQGELIENLNKEIRDSKGNLKNIAGTTFMMN